MVANRARGHSLIRWLAFAFLGALTAVLWWRGASFYSLPTAKRPDHPAYRQLAATGSAGLTYGAIGTILIFTNLLYVLRRKLASWRVGSLAGWLHLHVFTGLTGAVLIVFHSAFQLRNGVAAISAYSLGIVVFTGAVGRYLHTLTPTVDRSRMATIFHALDVVRPKLGSNLRNALQRMPVTHIESHLTLARALARLPRWWKESYTRGQLMTLARKAARRELSPAVAPEADKLMHELGTLARREVSSVVANSLLRTWRPMHRFFAILMLLAVSVHIGIAWYYGYRWIL